MDYFGWVIRPNHMTDKVHLYFDLVLDTLDGEVIIGELRHSHDEWFFERLKETKWVEGGTVHASTRFKEIHEAIISYIDDYMSNNTEEFDDDE